MNNRPHRCRLPYTRCPYQCQLRTHTHAYTHLYTPRYTYTKESKRQVNVAANYLRTAWTWTSMLVTSPSVRSCWHSRWTSNMEYLHTPRLQHFVAVLGCRNNEQHDSAWCACVAFRTTLAPQWSSYVALHHGQDLHGPVDFPAAGEDLDYRKLRVLQPLPQPEQHDTIVKLGQWQCRCLRSWCDSTHT